MKTIITLTAAQAASMADIIKLIKTTSVILTLNVAENGNYIQNSMAFANESEQVQAIAWSQNVKGKGLGEKTELIVDSQNMTESLDVLKGVGKDIEIREDKGAYYFFIEGAVPSVPIKRMEDRPVINVPEQSSMVAQYQIKSKELIQRTQETERADINSTMPVAKSITFKLTDDEITAISTNGSSLGLGIIKPDEAGDAKNSGYVGVSAKFMPTIRKVAGMAENVNIAIFDKTLCVGTGNIVYLTATSTSVLPENMFTKCDTWLNSSYEAKFTVDGEKLLALVNVLRIGASNLNKPVIIFSGGDGKIQMNSFDGASVILPTTAVEGRIEKVGLSSAFLEKMVRQLKKGNVTFSVTSDIKDPVLIQNGTIEEPCKESLLFLMKTSLQAAQAEAEKEAAEKEKAEPEESEQSESEEDEE